MIRALVIDDDAVVRGAIRKSFQRAGEIELVGEASSALDGIMLAREHLPDVIVLDNQLHAASSERNPMLGIDAIRHLKAVPSRPIIVMFSVSPTLETSALAAGADAFVLKSGPRGLLLATVQRLAGDQRPGSS